MRTKRGIAVTKSSTKSQYKHLFDLAISNAQVLIDFCPIIHSRLSTAVDNYDAITVPKQTGQVILNKCKPDHLITLCDGSISTEFNKKLPIL